jgi:hypothetical protein
LVPAGAGNATLDVRDVSDRGAEKTNAFDRALSPVPPGPTALTRASYVVLAVNGQAVTVLARSTRIRPSAPGAGFPRLVVWNGLLAPG